MAVGVAVCPGCTTVVGVKVGLAVNVGRLSTATCETSRERRRKLLMPKQYRSSVKRVVTIRRLYDRLCVTVSLL